MRSRIAGLCLTATLFVASNAAMAKDYLVEAIVFQNPAAEQDDSEAWNFSPERLSDRFRHMAELAARPSDHEFSRQLEKLDSVRQRLLGSGYRILQTVSWRQPSSSYRDAPVIPLGSDSTELASGFLRIYTTSLIYADLDLLLSPRVVPGIGAVGSLDSLNPGTDTTFHPPHYFLSEKRRLKFKELHYFDHPRFGAIVGVWPVEAGPVGVQ